MNLGSIVAGLLASGSTAQPQFDRPGRKLTAQNRAGSTRSHRADSGIVRQSATAAAQEKSPVTWGDGVGRLPKFALAHAATVVGH